ncbi:hypothetical protein H6P81_017142 [Aristolochia fimbriata]|uniref:Ribosomal protein S3 n=1 Tax=Aristolochia fimbriata TaxID=158543 RepID=A0AAV7E1J6_ARIFI|nr:hypothetical protein H6P81_017142 [Aristolochia fimbriata]
MEVGPPFSSPSKHAPWAPIHITEQTFLRYVLLSKFPIRLGLLRYRGQLVGSSDPTVITRWPGWPTILRWLRNPDNGMCEIGEFKARSRESVLLISESIQTRCPWHPLSRIRIAEARSSLERAGKRLRLVQLNLSLRSGHDLETLIHFFNGILHRGRFYANWSSDRTVAQDRGSGTRGAAKEGRFWRKAKAGEKEFRPLFGVEAMAERGIIAGPHSDDAFGRRKVLGISIIFSSLLSSSSSPSSVSFLVLLCNSTDARLWALRFSAPLFSCSRHGNSREDQGGQICKL